MGARGGMIAPDETTFAYVKGREFAPKGEDWEKAVAYWRTLPSDPDAEFDREINFDAADIEPRITFGTNPGMGIGINDPIPAPDPEDEAGKISYEKSLYYMGFKVGQVLAGTPVDYVSSEAAPTDESRISAHSPTLSKVKRKPPALQRGSYPALGKSTHKYAKKAWTKFLKKPDLKSVSPDARHASP